MLRELLGDADRVADRTAVLERLEATSHDRVARYRELLAVVKGGGPLPAHREEFGWVVAALRARPGR